MASFYTQLKKNSSHQGKFVSLYVIEDSIDDTAEMGIWLVVKLIRFQNRNDSAFISRE